MLNVSITNQIRFENKLTQKNFKARLMQISIKNATFLRFDF